MKLQLLVVISVSAGFLACSPKGAPALPAAPVGPTENFGIDLGYVMPEVAPLAEIERVPGGAAMNEIVRQGARAVAWAETLQRELEPSKREQLWRRIDGIGHEATPDAPLKYNPEIIQRMFDESLEGAPIGVADVVRGSGELPLSPAPGVAVSDVIPVLRKVSKAYSRASRWIGLYPYHSQLSRGMRDLRPWVELDRARDALDLEARGWAQMSASQRRAWFDSVARACEVAGSSARACLTQYGYVLTENDPNQALNFLNRIHRRGQIRYEARFGVQTAHPGIERTVGADGTVHVTFPMYRVPADILSWISTQVAVGWRFPGSVVVDLSATFEMVSGAVKVEWEAGALPHVNAVGGDTITMDANQPGWLEQSQVTMTHEFGHVIGFPDCYVEFWDERETTDTSAGGSFVFYSLDPEDRMCALSGGTLERHRQALLAGFPAPVAIPAADEDLSGAELVEASE